MTLTAEPPPKKQIQLSDYSLVGENTRSAIAAGLAEADWYQSPIPRDTMKQLLVRRNGPAIRDTIIWFALLALSGALAYYLFPSPWCILPFLVYGAIYGSSSDSRWHESSHGTAFKSDFLNNALYEIASFMVMRESTVWRWSHTRHHSDTIIVGRDPEIAVPRPPKPFKFILGFTGYGAAKSYFQKILRHSFGKLDPEEATYIPDSARPTIYFKARIYLLIYLSVIAACIVTRSILPLLFIGLPNIYGHWLMPIYGLTQHTGLAENVLDHRMNCRTVYMNPIHRFLYWNMNYHVEHHMFPLVPYHNLPKLHAAVKNDMPVPYRSILHAWSEIIPTVLRQAKDPGYYIKRQLPTPTIRAVANLPAKSIESELLADKDGWIEVAPADALEPADVLRFDHNHKTYAVYRTADNLYCATDGMCTHGNTHLATGLVIDHQIECPKHNGRFDITDGSPKRPPVCSALRTYQVKVANNKISLNTRPANIPAQKQTTYNLRVVSNKNVATFIKELVLELAPDSPALHFKPGQYLQLNIPSYDEISFKNFSVGPPYHAVWQASHVYDYACSNHTDTRRNYSLASNPHLEKTLRFNVRISTPPRGQDCPAGVGSTYVWNLKPSDTLTAVGPFGEFLVKESNREMIYLGGGAGMAPLRAHLSFLLETQNASRKISYWYGARSKQEIFYHDYFQDLAATHPNFHFHLALSEPLPADNWTSHTGYIHEVLLKEYLANHPNPTAIEYYLCGPQPMIHAARKMLADLNIPPTQIAYDEF